MQWFHNYKALQSSEDFQIKKQDRKWSLHVPKTYEEDQGEYRVRATSPMGEAVSIADMNIIRDQLITDKGLDEKVRPNIKLH